MKIPSPVVLTMAISSQRSPVVLQKCLKNVYNLDELPKEKGSSASYCNPDTYTKAYLAMLFGDEKLDESKNAIWWLKFWNENYKNIVWSSEKGIYLIEQK